MTLYLISYWIWENGFVLFNGCPKISTLIWRYDDEGDDDDDDCNDDDDQNDDIDDDNDIDDDDYDDDGDNNDDNDDNNSAALSSSKLGRLVRGHRDCFLFPW